VKFFAQYVLTGSTANVNAAAVSSAGNDGAMLVCGCGCRLLPLVLLSIGLFACMHVYMGMACVDKLCMARTSDWRRDIRSWPELIRISHRPCLIL
jgi:hypothetical protein